VYGLFQQHGIVVLSTNVFRVHQQNWSGLSTNVFPPDGGKSGRKKNKK
jgi:hypothetical protein